MDSRCDAESDVTFSLVGDLFSRAVMCKADSNLPEESPSLPESVELVKRCETDLKERILHVSSLFERSSSSEDDGTTTLMSRSEQVRRTMKFLTFDLLWCVPMLSVIARTISKTKKASALSSSFKAMTQVMIATLKDLESKLNVIGKEPSGVFGHDLETSLLVELLDLKQLGDIRDKCNSDIHASHKQSAFKLRDIVGAFIIHLKSHKI
jgi:hypothetical protein